MAGTPRFHTTRWSLVLSAQGDDEAGRRALADLCQIYWYPLYAFLRRRGEDAEQAADLTQGFFARLIEKADLESADEARGRFRSFLLKSLQNFSANEWAKTQSLKRGAGVEVLSLDVEDAEARYAREPADELTPERLFERRWALTVLAEVLDQLAAEMAKKGAADLYDRLKVYLEGDGSGPAYAEVAMSLGMTEGALKVAVHRLRRRFRELLRAEVGHTLEDRAQADAEVGELLAALRG